MPILIDSLKLLLLFIALSGSASFTVKHIKYLGAVLKIRLFMFGILLGLITSLPELSLGINASIDNATALSVGNLLGGIIVMLGLILGISLLLNKKIRTDGRFASLIPTVLVIFSMILLGIDGTYDALEGMGMIGLYLGLIFYLYRLNHVDQNEHIEIKDSTRVGKSILLAIAGIVGILITSHWIIGITLDLLNYIQVSQLLIGLIVFSLGTNLPEISIAVTSWRKKSSELSLSHLLCSSFTNVLILGILALLRPIVFDTDSSFWTMALFLGVILALFTYFYHSGRKMDQREGAILLVVYSLFVIANIYFRLFP
jgi:cation:H+ antiporter